VVAGQEHEGDGMGLRDKLRGELVDVIEWLDPSRDTIVWRFARHHNEIKMGARLTVREGQAAVFVNEGQVADVFPPGMYTLETQNLPVLSTLRGWKHGFQSPFKAEVYFVSTRQFPDQKWGTQNPILMRDSEFGMVRVRAYGGFAFRVVDPELLLKELVGTDPQFRADEVGEHLRQQVVARVATALATAGVPVLDLAAHQNDVAARLVEVISGDLAELGLEIARFVIENVSLPPEVEQALDKRTSMGVIGDLDSYTRYQTAEAVTMAAQNEGGAAGAGVGLGLGAGIGAQVAASMASAAVPAQPAGQAATPPPLPVASWFVAVDGQQQGPFAEQDVRSRLASGELTVDSLVWRDGMDGWVRLAHVPELAPATPPPLPS
jgi:membrane protease subunit (stomatin/prohibitin family)